MKKIYIMTTRQYARVVKKGVSESLKSGFQLTQEMEIEHQTKLGFFVTFLKHQKHVVPIIFCKITVVTLIEHLLWQKTLNDIKNNESAVCLHFSWLFTWFCLWYSFHSRYESPFLQHTSELGQPLELKLLSIWSLAPEQCSPKTSCSSKKLHLSFLWILLFFIKTYQNDTNHRSQYDPNVVWFSHIPRSINSCCQGHHNHPCGYTTHWQSWN